MDVDRKQMDGQLHSGEHSSSAEISEIFSSLQGEGPYLGLRQIFVRFGRCNMHCGYCDELEKMQKGVYSRKSLNEVMREVTRLHDCEGEPHSVSLTGGEPLMYGSFLAKFMPALKAAGYRTYLETNGTLPRELSEVIAWTDIIAMDLKPPSSSGDRDFWLSHEAFISTALKKELFVKVVITPETNREDVERCVRLVADKNPKTCFVFQPLSEAVGISERALKRIESEFFSIASSQLSNVRVIPQMHKIWGVR